MKNNIQLERSPNDPQTIKAHLLLIKSTFIKYNMFEETIDSQSFITVMRIKS